MKFFRRRRNPDDFTAEVRAHLEQEEAELRAAGRSPDDARAEARRRFGNPARAIEDVCDARPLRLLATLWQDAKFGVRLIRRNPAFSITAVVVLSLGIGVNTALFSIVNALFFTPLPVRAPEELFYLYNVYLSNSTGSLMEADRIEFFETHGAALADWTSHAEAEGRLTIATDTQRATGAAVAANYFDVLGVAPALGRSLRPEDEDIASPDLAIVIGHDLWMRRFGGDAGALGAEVRLNDRHFRVVGVMPPGFTGLASPWRPAQFWVTMTQLTGRPRPGGGPVGRLKPGVSFEQMQTFVAQKSPELRDVVWSTLAQRTRERFPNWMRGLTFPIHRAVDVRIPGNPDATVVPRDVLAGLIVVVGLVLVIAAANIAGLLLARGVTRTGEVAIRRALGAGGARVTRQLLTETVVLAALGGALGLAVSSTLLGLFRAYAPPRLAIDVPLDVRVLLFATACCLGAGMLVGLGPALQAARVNVLEALGSGIVGARLTRARLRHWIVIPQVALTLVLLVAAAVHVRALVAVESRDLGYRTDDVIVLSLWRSDSFSTPALRSRTREDIRREQDQDAAATRSLNRTVLQRVGALPAVRSFAISSHLPVRYATPTVLMPVITAAGDPSRVSSHRRLVSDGFFDVMGIRLLQGRTFDSRDVLYGRRVAVVSAELARSLWPAQSPIGQTLAFAPRNASDAVDWLDVIGVVNDTDSVEGAPGERAVVYESVLQQWRGAASHLVVRGQGDRDALIRAVKDAVLSADGLVEVTGVTTLRAIVGEMLYPRRMAAGILTASGAIGLLLAAVGLYGLLSYSVAQRIREIGIRTTLGADRKDIVSLVLRDAGRVAGIGIVLGTGLAVLALELATGVFQDVPPGDVLSFVSVPIGVAFIVVIACLVPARRASGVDPAQVLRM